ncbi:hypothetical protein ANANG_G00003790 [Anguilla anguilla]|uniref:Uncharacterized protein n=1 Tax=Anguilla anguilla TaxID=7936 RepID=A0A9D3MVX7_ANGAN|nr:hypothetical protein ANANG_G00003790 [Anguilla anguilla]
MALLAPSSGPFKRGVNTIAPCIHTFSQRTDQLPGFHTPPNIPTTTTTNIPHHPPHPQALSYCPLPMAVVISSFPSHTAVNQIIVSLFLSLSLSLCFLVFFFFSFSAPCCVRLLCRPVTPGAAGPNRIAARTNSCPRERETDRDRHRGREGGREGERKRERERDRDR